MKPPTPVIRSLARRLLECETGGRRSAEAVATGAAAVLRKIAGDLEPLVGPTGFRVLLARALHLARTESALLEAVASEAGADAGLEGLGERVAGRDPGEVREAVTAVLAGFLGLVAHFIGDDLTVRIVSRAWPDVPPGTAGSAFEGEAV